MTSVRVKSAGPVHLPAASGDGSSGDPLNLKVVACDETGTPYSLSNPLPVAGDFGGAGGAVDTDLVTVTGSYPLSSDLSAVTEANVKIATEAGPGTLTVTIGASTGFARRIVDVVSGPGDVTPFTVAFADAVILGAWDGLADAWFQRFDCVPDGAGEWYAYRVPYFAAEVAGGSGTPDDGSVTTAKIVDSNVTTAKIADANVTLAKLANLATATVIGRNTAGTGVPEAVTMAQLRDLIDADDKRAVAFPFSTYQATSGTVTPSGSVLYTLLALSSYAEWTVMTFPAGTWRFALNLVTTNGNAASTIQLAVGGVDLGSAISTYDASATPRVVVADADKTFTTRTLAAVRWTTNASGAARCVAWTAWRTA